jgi:hypothetical protein
MTDDHRWAETRLNHQEEDGMMLLLHRIGAQEQRTGMLECVLASCLVVVFGVEQPSCIGPPSTLAERPNHGVLSLLVYFFGWRHGIGLGPGHGCMSAKDVRGTNMVQTRRLQLCRTPAIKRHSQKTFYLCLATARSIFSAKIKRERERPLTMASSQRRR